MKRILLTAALALSLLGAAQADDYTSEIKQAERLGEEIYKQDIAAWVTTDDLLAYMENNEDFAAGNLGGWLSYADGNNYKTVFVSKDKENPKAVYEATSKNKKVKKSRSVDRNLTKREAGLWRARNLMLTQDFDVCTEYTPYNSIVIEKDDGSGYFGYLFASTKKSNLIVLGRHYRFDINKDATKVSGVHAFTNSCFALPIQTGPNGEKPVGLVASHLVTDYPQEHHVFANLMWDIDLFITVGEGGSIWQVSDGQIGPTK